jgi:RNA polymerase sigma-70 factor (ECF subfamily)
MCCGRRISMGIESGELVEEGGEWQMNAPEFMTWVDELIREYSNEKKQLELYRQTIDRTHAYGQVEAQIVSGMIGEMQYALSWMKRGRRPGNRRGIERQKVYNRAVLAKLVQEQMPNLTENEKRKIVDALFELTPRERKCFILHMAYGLTFQEIADMMKLSKSSVQVFLQRAKRKLEAMSV